MEKVSVTINGIGDSGLNNIIMSVNDIIKRNMIIREGDGLQVGHEWITPESCYNLYKLLSLHKGSCIVDDKVLDALKNGTNHPESL